MTAWQSPYLEQVERVIFADLHAVGVTVTCLADHGGDGCDCNLVTNIALKALDDAGFDIVKRPKPSTPGPRALGTCRPGGADPHGHCSTPHPEGPNCIDWVPS